MIFGDHNSRNRELYEQCHYNPYYQIKLRLMEEHKVDITYTFHEAPKNKLVRIFRGFVLSYIYMTGKEIKYVLGKSDLKEEQIYEVRIKLP